MSGHTPWREIGHKSRENPSGVEWTLVMRRPYRPWWGLGLVRRWREIAASHFATEETMHTMVSDLQEQFPRWRMDLRRK